MTGWGSLKERPHGKESKLGGDKSGETVGCAGGRMSGRESLIPPQRRCTTVDDVRAWVEEERRWQRRDACTDGHERTRTAMEPRRMGQTGP
jgi:hypothetical protein